MKLTQMAVLALRVPVGKIEHFVWDDDVAGFGVRVRAERVTWVIQYRIGIKQRRITLGNVKTVDAVKARKAAKDHLAAIRLGADPQADKIEARAKASITLGSKVEMYLETKEQSARPNTMKGVRLDLRTHWKALHGLPLHRIGRADVSARVAEMKVQNGEVAADRARTALSGFFAWAIGEGLCDVNPVIGTNRPNSRKKRDRVLSDDELKAIWASCRDDDYGRIIKLLILLGCRESEIAGMAWSELDLAKAVWTIPEERAKGKRDHPVALMGPVLDILGGIPRRAGRDLLFGSGLRPFSGFSCAKKSLDGRIAKAVGERLSPWRVHDLRHTVATKMGDPLGILPHIVDEVLGHVGTHKAGVAGVYNHATYWSEVCKAMMLWGDYVGSVVTDAPRKFATLQRVS